MGTLYVVGTPIGNLEDVSVKALKVLRQVQLIAAENPQRTQRLLARYGIRTRMMRYTDAYDRKKSRRIQAILTALETGDVALVSEAGMPGLADPGYDLLQAALERNVPIVPIPGPTALATALSVAGIQSDRFVYLGFLPRRSSARRKVLAPWLGRPFAIVAHEAPHRLVSTLQDFVEVFGDRPVAVACELTKLYEEIRCGTPVELLAHYRAQKPRGEFTLVISQPSSPLPAGRKQESPRREAGVRVPGQEDTA
jgi:16S rRNA (cytidine1402-2'-O)-methyltransferase